MTSTDTPTVLCHHCGAELPRGSRDAAVLFPCCGHLACERARKRKYAAAARIRARVAKETT